mgnify:CR=1 FL=1
MTGKTDPTIAYLNDAFATPASLAGMPAISVPFGYDDQNLPIGMQLIADHFDEKTMFNFALSLKLRK